MAQASLEWVVSIICATVVNRTFVKVAGYCLFDGGRELLLSVTCSFCEILLVNFSALYLKASYLNYTNDLRNCRFDRRRVLIVSLLAEWRQPQVL